MTSEEHWDAIPPALQSGLTNYLDHHITPGSCLLAILCGDLHEVMRRADLETLAALKSISEWLIWNVPCGCWGSLDKVNAWLTADISDEDECRHALEFAP